MNAKDQSAMCLIRALDADRKAQGFVQARLGRRRWFLSQRDADAHDRGFNEFDPGVIVGEFGPYADGWWDAFSEHEERAMDSLEVDVTEDE